MKYPVKITVNGKAFTQDVEPRLLLVHFLRDTAGLTGTKVGCDTSQCGVVHRAAGRGRREVVHLPCGAGRRRVGDDDRGSCLGGARSTICRKPSGRNTVCSAASARPG